VYYDVPIPDLKLVEGSLPEEPKRPSEINWRYYNRANAMRPYAFVEGPGEAYLTGPGNEGNYYAPSFGSPQAKGQDHILLSAPEGKEVKGRLVLVKADWSGMDLLRFVVPASAAKPEAKPAFYRAKLDHYQGLFSSGIPGGAWF